MSLAIVSDNSLFWKLTNDLQAAIDTGNIQEVDLVATKIAEAYEDGAITPDMAGELSYDIVVFRDGIC